MQEGPAPWGKGGEPSSKKTWLKPREEKDLREEHLKAPSLMRKECPPADAEDVRAGPVFKRFRAAAEEEPEKQKILAKKG